MDSESLEDPHDSQYNINSPLNNNTSTSGIKVTKLNESTLTKVEEKKIENFKIGLNHDIEISKQPVPVKQSSINENNIDHHKISISLVNSSSTRATELTKVNESTSTKVQEQKKIENFKNVDNGVEIIKQQVPLKKMMGTTFVINAPKKNENNIDSRYSHCDSSSALNNNDRTHGREVNKLNESTATIVQEQKKTVNLKIVESNDIKISKQVPLKKMIATTYVINSSQKKENNIYLRPNNFSLNLEKIAVPKTVISNVKIIPSFLSSQNKKPPTISLIPASTHSFIRPKPAIVTNIKPKLNPAEVPNNKCVSTLKPGFKIISSSDSKSKMFILPQGVNYILKTVKKEEVNNQTLPSLSPKSTILKPLNSIIPISVAEKFNTIEKQEIKNDKSKFVFGMKEFQNQSFKVILNKENAFIKEASDFFKSSTNFQLIFPRSSKSFVRNQKRSLKPHTDLLNPKVIKIAGVLEPENIQQERELSFRKLSLNEIKNSTDFKGRSEEKKLIAHTITSKDVIDNHSNIVIENDKQVKKNVNKELCPTSGFIQLSSRPESLIKTYGQSLTVSKYGSVTNEVSPIRLIPIGSVINPPNTKLNKNIPGDGKHLFIKILNTNGSTSNAKVSTDKIMKVIPRQIYASKNQKITIAPKQNQKKLSHSKPSTMKFLLPKEIKKEPKEIKKEPKEIKKEKQDSANCEKRSFVCCQYEYCGKIINESEIIDKSYCSFVCKKLDTKLKIATEKSVVIEQPQEELPRKPVIDRKMLLAKLKSRINKRKQSLPSYHKENKTQHADLVEVQKPDEETCKMPPPIPVTVKHSFQKSQNRRKYSKSSGAMALVQNSKLENEKILSYLQHTNYIAAPKKLFDNPLPSNCNPFKVGQRLEGIDPEHEALFCVMTVVEVLGYRIKLHFDGYPDIYDFWVNSNCPDLFFPRWCDENSRTLQPPKNYNLPFNWTDYLKLPGVTPAPKWNFPSTEYIVNRNTVHSFCIGAKLEALDKLTRTLPKQLICVATVADILNNRIRIHFDGWTDDFDYWTDITSTNIHPVGWCDKNGRTLCPPSGYDDCRGKKPFSWTNYLKETNSEPVPEDAFVRRPLREFTNTMAIEVVDIANPSLVRIAKVVDVRGDELKILYDGFDTIYAYWIEDDSPNIHPLGWCLATNHPIELFKVNALLWTCRVPGCNGKGNTNSSINTHVFARDCPYEFESWKKTISGLINIPDRLKPDEIPVSVESCSKSVSNVLPQEDKKKPKSKLNKKKSYNFNKPKRRTVNNKSKKNFKKKIPNGRSKTVYTRAVEAMNEIENIKGVNDYTSYGYGSFKSPRLNVWCRHNVLRGIPIFNTSDVREWPIKEVATFVEKVVSNNYTDNNPSERIKISKQFIDQEIDGDVFLMLTQKDLTDILNIPLGPALKLHNAIVVLRQRTSGFDVANGLL